MALYQTVEDRNNPDEVEANAPFYCNEKNAWLGMGYYFWDTFIQNAHWWGSWKYKNGYVIVEFTCKPKFTKSCFDLHGNMEQVQYFNEIIDYLKQQNLCSDKTTVAVVIEFLKKTTDFLSRFNSIRAYGHNSKSNMDIIPFVCGGRHFLDLTPAVQVCVFEKNSEILSEGKIVHPTNYVAGYLA